MANFTQWKELRELVRKSAIHFELSLESEKVALQSALESPVHAFDCYKAIERSYEPPTARLTREQVVEAARQMDFSSLADVDRGEPYQIGKRS